MAALGGDVIVDTVDGKVLYEVKPGTQTDTKVRLRVRAFPLCATRMCGATIM